MFMLTASGLIDDVKTTQTKNGDPLLILKISSRSYLGMDRDTNKPKYQYHNIECITSNENVIRLWSNFKPNDVVEVVGQPSFNTWQTNSGDTRVDIKMTGIDGLAPYVKYGPKELSEDQLAARNNRRNAPSAVEVATADIPF